MFSCTVIGGISEIPWQCQSDRDTESAPTWPNPAWRDLLPAIRRESAALATETSRLVDPPEKHQFEQKLKYD